MLPIPVSVTLTAGSATAVATAQTLGSATNFTLNGGSVVSGVAVFAAPRRVLFTFAANETGHTFTVYGVGHNGQTISEAVAGTTAGTVYTTNDFLTVTRVASSAATTGNVSIGTNTVASSRWVYISPHMTPTNLSLSGYYSAGTGTYEWEYTYQDPAGDPSAFPIAPITPHVWVDPGGIQSGAYDTTFAFPVQCVRVTVLTGTGTFAGLVTQAGISGP